MPKILLITYLFPPSGGVGIPRAIAYTRYLPAHGCRVFVVTARRPATPLYDPDLLNRVPAETVVHRCFNPELPYTLRDALWRQFSAPHRVSGVASAVQSSQKAGHIIKAAVRRAIEGFTFPDVQSGWVPFALRAAENIIEREEISAVLLNVPPFSSFKFAVALRRKYPELKIITDIRDDWLGYYLVHFDTADTRKIQKARDLESQAVAASTYVSIVTPAMVRQLRARYRDQDPDKFLYTPNGYEPDDFKNFVPTSQGGDRLVVTYFGTVYMSKVYSPLSYFDAVSSLPEEIRSNIETRFIGRVPAEAQTYLSRREECIRQLGFMPKTSGIGYLQETDLLLLTANDPTTHAGKLFDYLATGKPILAISPPEGEVAKILKETRTGWCADAEDASAIRETLLTAWEMKKQGGGMTINPDWGAIRMYSWPEIVKRLVNATGIGTNHVPCVAMSVDRLSSADPEPGGK